MRPRATGVLWPTRKDYPRFVAVADDEVHATYDAFVGSITPKLQRIAAQGIRVEQIEFDPDVMAQWCRTRFGKVDAESRAAYAAFRTGEKYESAKRD